MTHYRINKMGNLAEDGIYMAEHSQVSFWVFRAHCGTNFAIQLNESPYAPKFSFYDITKADLGLGIWIGTGELETGARVTNSGSRRAGVLVLKNSNFHFRATLPDGRGYNVPIPYQGVGCERWHGYSYCYDWTLWCRVANHRFPFMNAPELPVRTVPYPGRSIELRYCAGYDA
ncbi:hypothetical protein [Sphingomonas turrisvirgatae]|uniref:hypothetical protein n=1 Tax=Sphingomonas turrisvirgatae TaxID=1888892 RepID=UPI00156AC007|nr:hypothetical protein [Sphingomonas turrisvirgatae]